MCECVCVRAQVYVSPEITNLFMRFWFQFELCVNDSPKHIIKKTIDSKRKWLEDVNNNGYRTQNIGSLHIWNKCFFGQHKQKRKQNNLESGARAFHYLQFIIVCWWFLSRYFENGTICVRKNDYDGKLGPHQWISFKTCNLSVFVILSVFFISFFLVFFFVVSQTFDSTFFSIFQFLFSKDFLTHMKLCSLKERRACAILLFKISASMK